MLEHSEGASPLFALLPNLRQDWVAPAPPALEEAAGARTASMRTRGVSPKGAEKGIAPACEATVQRVSPTDLVPHARVRTRLGVQQPLVRRVVGEDLIVGQVLNGSGPQSGSFRALDGRIFILKGNWFYTAAADLLYGAVVARRSEWTPERRKLQAALDHEDGARAHLVPCPYDALVALLLKLRPLAHGPTPGSTSVDDGNARDAFRQDVGARVS